MLVKEKSTRIPWREYLSEQIVKLLGLGFITLLLVLTMNFSSGLDLNVLSTVDYNYTNYLIVIILSSLAFILVLVGFSKIILFDMAEEFGLRDDNGNMVYNLRFLLLLILALSFCSSIYLLLDVHLRETYLVIIPVLLMRISLESLDFDIVGLSNLGGREFYQTARNLYFGIFFLIIIGFSIIVFLAILTTYARRRIVKRFKKEEEVKENEKKGIRAIYKLFLWILIPPSIYFAMMTQLTSSSANEAVGPIIIFLSLLALVWWVYQILKIIFLIVWRGVKITAFITSVNLLVIIPLIIVLWLLPVFLWSIVDVWDVLRVSESAFVLGNIVNNFISAFLGRIVDIPSLIQLDFIIITSVATLVVGFAEGFALIAIISALSRGVEVARTGRILARSPPKVVVLSKYLILFGVWISLLWDSFAGIVSMLVITFNIDLGITVPDFFETVYEVIIIPISEWFATIWPTLKSLPFLIIPIIIIFSGAFKFLSVTLITPRVKERGDVFFLLISTAFVLIVTNILGYIYELNIPDAPFLSIIGFSELLFDAFYIFADVESLAFYGGFFFGIGWVFWKMTHWRRTGVTHDTQTELKLQADELSIKERDLREKPVTKKEVIEKDITEEIKDEVIVKETAEIEEEE